MTDFEWVWFGWCACSLSLYTRKPNNISQSVCDYNVKMGFSMRTTLHLWTHYGPRKSNKKLRLREGLIVIGLLVNIHTGITSTSITTGLRANFDQSDSWAQHCWLFLLLLLSLLFMFSLLTRTTSEVIFLSFSGKKSMFKSFGWKFLTSGSKEYKSTKADVLVAKRVFFGRNEVVLK